MFIFHRSVLANRNHLFSVRASYFVVYLLTLIQIFFGVAKGCGALTDIVATIAMSVFPKSSKTGMHEYVLAFLNFTPSNHFPLEEQTSC